MGADNTAPVTGVLYGGGWNVFLAQLVGNAIITLSTFAVAMLVMFIVSKLPYPFKLRVEEKGETAFGGLDVFEHGAEAYNN